MDFVEFSWVNLLEMGTKTYHTKCMQNPNLVAFRSNVAKFYCLFMKSRSRMAWDQYCYCNTFSYVNFMFIHKLNPHTYISVELFISLPQDYTCVHCFLCIFARCLMCLLVLVVNGRRLREYVRGQLKGLNVDVCIKYEDFMSEYVQ